MKKDFQIAVDKQRSQLTASLKGVARQIATLGPSPDNPGVSGPAFVKSHSAARIGGERDGMLGSLFLDMAMGGFLGVTLGELVPALPDGVSALGVAVAMDVADEIWMDRRQANDNMYYQLGLGGPMSGAFNATVRRNKIEPTPGIDMSARERKDLGAAYANMSRKLDGWMAPRFPQYAI